MPTQDQTAARYQERRRLGHMPRLPLEGSLDLTYRCNNRCRHCWLHLPAQAPEQADELSTAEIIRLVTEARAMGCRSWAISGGEPLLRPDFPELFEFITAKALFYSLNTNGTLITPATARLLRRKGAKMVALYGATAAVHDHITRTPGSFEAVMQGLAYLKEAGAGFTVQIIPMRDNYHQFEEMVKLALSLSPHYRVGSAWLFLSASGSPRQNAEIARQRLDAAEVVKLDRPNPSFDEWLASRGGSSCQAAAAEGGLLAACIANHREFHVDPYGGMSFCCFIKDPGLRYDLKRGSLREGWEHFIPALAERVPGGEEYREHCGSCELSGDCRWCDVYSYLEHRRHGAPVDYLCQVARETRAFKEHWRRRHRRFFEVAGISLQVEADLPLTDGTFAAKFQEFEVDALGPGEETVRISHHFGLPDLKSRDLGKEVHRKPPWVIFRKERAWIYLGVSPQAPAVQPHLVAVFSRDHTRGRIFHAEEEVFRRGGHPSLTLFPTDQILLARVLADRRGCFLHAGGVSLDGRGLLFVGHSGAGKSSVIEMLSGKAEVLSDDRTIVRRWPEGFKIYGSWSHGKVPVVSAASAPLTAILFLHKSPQNRLVPLKGSREIATRLLACLIKPLTTADWWEKSMALVESLVREVPCYLMEFDLSGKIVSELERFIQGGRPAAGRGLG